MKSPGCGSSLGLTKKISLGLALSGRLSCTEFLQQHSNRSREIVAVPASLSHIYSIRGSLQAFSRKIFDADILPGNLPLYLPPTKKADLVGIVTHNGAHYFSIGQKKRPDVGLEPENPYLFICYGTQVRHHLYRIRGEHPGLLVGTLCKNQRLSQWIRPDKAFINRRNCPVLLARIRGQATALQALFDKGKRKGCISFR